MNLNLLSQKIHRPFSIVVLAGLLLALCVQQTFANSQTTNKNSNSNGTDSTLFDFDGDGKADISVYRRSTGMWYRINSSDNSISVIKFGMENRDFLSPADYDGDGITDIAVYRAPRSSPFNVTFHILDSSTGNYRVDKLTNVLGNPFPGDWDGDGKADPTVYEVLSQIPTDPTPPIMRFSFFESSNLELGQRYRSVRPGGPAVFGDFTGDGKSNLAAFYYPNGSPNGIWVIRENLATLNFIEISFGLQTDTPVPADYNGDGITDLAVYREGNWFILTDLNSTNYYVVPFGLPGDVPIPADYDGDGKTDVAVYRDGIWYIQQSTDGFKAVQFGLPDDKPTPLTYIDPYYD